MKKIKKLLAKFRQDFSDQHLSAEDADFASDKRSALLNKTNPILNITLLVIIAMAVMLLVWSYFATIDQVTVGTGKVIPASQTKVIDSLDGGIVADILVKEGQIVNKNQVLMHLDETRYKAEYAGAYEKYLALLANTARLQAESQQLPTISFPEELKKYPELTQRETRLFETRRNSLNEELALMQTSYEATQKQVAMYEKLLPEGYASRLEYLKTLQNSIETKSRLTQRRNDFQKQVKTDLTESNNQLESLREQIESLRDKMVHATIMSPVHGVIKKMYAHTIGGVITPGMDIMEIVPLSDKLLIEAQINPADIAFIHIGQPATVKITAYDFSIYGGLPGKVTRIGADTVTDARGAKSPVTGKEQEYYVVDVVTDYDYLGKEKQKLPIIPGMTATVHIETGRKTVLQYILKPLIKAKQEALRER